MTFFLLLNFWFIYVGLKIMRKLLHGKKCIVNYLFVYFTAISNKKQSDLNFKTKKIPIVEWKIHWQKKIYLLITSQNLDPKIQSNIFLFLVLLLDFLKFSCNRILKISYNCRQHQKNQQQHTIKNFSMNSKFSTLGPRGRYLSIKRTLLMLIIKEFVLILIL